MYMNTIKVRRSRKLDGGSGNNPILVRLIQPGMRLLELFGYGNPLGAFFLAFEALDAVVGLFFSWQGVIEKARRPGMIVDDRIVIKF